MSVPQTILDEIVSYHSNFRDKKLPPPDVSGLYDLFPEKPMNGHKAQYKWSSGDKWPHERKPGVYLIFDENMNLLYVGKSGNTSRRLYVHFGDAKNCTIRLEDNWSPRFVAVAALPTEREARAMEKHLIKRFQPPNNTNDK